MAKQKRKAAQGEPWFKKYPGCLLHEQDAMHQRFRQFALKKVNEEQLAWVGDLISSRNNQYKTCILYSTHHPHPPPKAYLLDPQVSGLHQYGDKSLCLMRSDEGTFQHCSTAAVIVALVAAWIFAYETHNEKCRRGPNGTPCSDFGCKYWPGKKH